MSRYRQRFYHPAGRNDSTSKICPICHEPFSKSFEITWSRWLKRIFCSRKCWANSPKAKSLQSNKIKKIRLEHPEIAQKAVETNIAKDPDYYFKLWKKNSLLVPREKQVEWGKIGGCIRGKNAVASGQIFNTNTANITYGACGIICHKHRSKWEISLCKKLQSQFPVNQIFANVIFNGKEIDFVIGTNSSDPASWQKIIETHACFWDKRKHIERDYTLSRTNELRKIGLKCPIEVIAK